MPQVPTSAHFYLLSRFHYYFSLFLFVGIIFSSIAVNKAALADVTTGIAWLKTQQQSNGAYGNETDISTEFQATAEVIATYRLVGETVPAKTLQTLSSFDYDNTETLARKIISGSLSAQAAGVAMTKLLSRQNRAGGFGEFEGYHSTPLDTAFVLQALAASNQASQDQLGSALNYIKNSQATDGSWAIPSVNDGQHYVTSQVLLALAHYRSRYALGAQIIPAVNWMKSQLSPQNTFANTHQNAMALLVLPAQISDTTILTALEEALVAEQDATGSWQSDVYLTALALRALKQYNSPPPSITSASVFGTLINKETGEPIAGGVVSVGDKQIESDAQGHFEVTGIPAGAAAFSVRAIAYQTLQNNFNLKAGDVIRLGNIELSPAALTAGLQGKITNSAGTPIAGAIVSVGTFNTTTDAQGNYTLLGINTGTGTISVIKPGYRKIEVNQSFEAGTTYQFSPTLYGVNVTPPPATLAGTVIDQETSLPLENVLIKIGAINQNSAQDGKFTLENVDTGKTNIVLSLAGYDTLNLNAQLAAGANRLGTVALKKAVTKSHVTGKIIDNTTGTAIENVAVTLLGSNAQATTDANGEFSLNDVTDLSFELNLSVGGYLEQTIQITLNSHGERNLGDIKLAKSDVNAEFATLKGRVIDSSGNPLAGVEVKVGGKTTITDGAGNYTLTEIANGSAAITLSKANYRSIERTQNFKKGFVYQLSPTLYKTNEPPAPTKLTGKVISKNTGNPLENVSIKVGSESAQTLLNGDFILEGLAEGEVLITLSLDGYVTQTLKATLVEGINNLGTVSLSEPLVSSSDFSVTSMVANKPTFSPGDVTEVEANIVNKGTETQSLVIELEVYDGNGVFLDSIPANRGLTGANGRPSNLAVTFSANEEREFDFGWLLQNYVAGNYSAIVKGRLGNQLVLEKSLSFSVSSEPVLQGSVTAEPPLVQLDAQTPIALSASFRNVGNEATPQGPMNLKIILEKVDTNQIQAPRTELTTITKDDSVPNQMFRLAVDSNDNNYLISNDRKKILKVLPDGTGTTTFFDLPIVANRQKQAWELEFDADDNLYVASWDTTNKGLVYKLDKTGQVLTTTAEQTNFNSMAISDNGDIYMTGKLGADEVLVKLAGGTEQVLVRNGLSNPQEMLLDNGFFYVSNYADGSIVKVEQSTGKITSFVSGLKNPKGLTKSSDGNFYVVTAGDGKIIKITPAGIMSDFASGLKNPSDLAFNASNELYVSSLTDHAIYKVSTTGELTLYAKSELGLPGAIAVDTNNDTVYVVSNNNSIVTKAANQVGYSSLVSGLNAVKDIEVAFDGSLFIAEYGAGKITHYVNNAKEDLATGLVHPFGIALNPSGEIAVSTSGKQIQFLDQAGTITKTIKTLLDSPNNMVFGENGDIYIQNSQHISVIEGGILKRIPNAGALSNIYKISFDPIKKKLIVFDATRKLYYLDKNGNKEYITLEPGAYLQTAVATDSLGKHYFVSTSARNKVKLLNADGSSTVVATFPNVIYDIRSDKNGKMYAFTADRYKLFEFDSAGTIRNIQFDKTNEYLYGFDVIEDGSLVTWTNYQRTYKINPSTGVSALIRTGSTPNRVTLDAQDRPIITAASAQIVYQYDANNAVSKTYYGFDEVYDIDWDNNNQKYVFVDNRARAYSLDSSGKINRIASSGVNTPYLYLKNNKIYFSHSNNLYALDSATGSATQLVRHIGSGFTGSVAQNAAGDNWLLSDRSYTGRLISFAASNYAVTDIQSHITNPQKILFDKNNRLIVGDSSVGIVAIDPSGSTQWLSGVRPTSLYKDQLGKVFASDTGNLYSFDENWAHTNINPSKINGHSGLRGFVSEDGTYYAFNNKSQLIKVDDNAWTVLASGLSRPAGMVFINDNLYIANKNTGTLVKYKNQELSVVSTRFTGVQTLTADADFIYGGFSNSILQYSPSTDKANKIRLGFNRAMKGLSVFSNGLVAHYDRYYIGGHYNNEFLKVELSQAETPPTEGSVVYETTQPFNPLDPISLDQDIDFGTWVAPYGGDFRIEVTYPGVKNSATNFIHVGGHIESDLVVMQSSLPVGDSTLPMCLNLSGADFASISKVDINQVRGVIDSPRPLGLSANKEGSIFFTENTSLFKATDNGRELVAGSLGGTAYGLGVDNAERFYTASKYNGSATFHLLRITQSGDITDVLDLGVNAVGGVQVNNKNEIVIGTNGKLLIVNQQGQMRSIAVSQLNPKQIAIDGKGNVYAQNANNSVIKIAPNGGVSIVFDRSTNPDDPGFEGDGYPTITADCADNLYVTATNWSKVPQQTGEEKILVQMNPSRNSLNVLFDITKIIQRSGDIDYLAYDRFGQRILMWDQHGSPKRILQVPVTCGAIDAKVHLFTKPDQSLTASTLEPNTSLEHTDRRTESVWDLRNVTAKGQSICFNVDVKGLTLGETRKAIDSGYLTFGSTFASNNIKVPLLVPSIQGDNIVELLVSTDKPKYPSNTDAKISTTFTNKKAEDVTGQLTLFIMDDQGQELAKINKGEVTIPANGELVSDAVWNTSNTLVGDYQVIAKLYQGDLLVAESNTDFKIQHSNTAEPVASLRITTDKPVYNTSDQVTIGSLSHNLAANVLIKTAVVKLIVKNPDGSVNNTLEQTVGDLPSGAIRQLNSIKALAAAPEGDYTVTAELLDKDNTVLATAQTQFAVAEALALTIQGAVQVSQQSIYAGAAQTCLNDIDNLGSLDLDNGVFRQVLVDIDKASETIIAKHNVAKITAGGKHQYNSELDTSKLSKGQYSCVLQRQDGANWKTLAYQFFKVDMLAMTATLDAAQYPANAPVKITLKVDNPTGVDFSGNVKLSILDANANVVEELTLINAAVNATQSLDLNAVWHTQTQLAGNYQVKASLLNSAGESIELHTLPFEISAAPAASLNLSVDKDNYNAGDVVTLIQLVQNTTLNAPLTQATLKTTVKNAAGTVIYSHSKPLNNLAINESQTISHSFTLAANSQLGDYQVISQVLKDSKPLIGAQSSFIVEAPSASSITGHMTVKHSQIKVGDSQQCISQISNSSNAILNTLPVRQIIRPLNSQTEVAHHDQTIKLLAKSQQQLVYELPPAAREAGNYLCILQAKVNGSYRTLDSSPFVVKGDLSQPAVRLTLNTDKPQYPQGARVQLNQQVSNTQAGTNLQGARLKTVVKDVQGRTVFQATRPLQPLVGKGLNKAARIAQGAGQAFNFNFILEKDAPIGNYNVASEVIDDKQKVIANAQANFNVQAVVVPPPVPHKESIPSLSSWSLWLLIISLLSFGYWRNRDNAVRQPLRSEQGRRKKPRK